MKAGQIFDRFALADGRSVILRSVRWEDLDQLIVFANSLVDEREEDPSLGILLDTHQTIETEGEWLSKKLVSMERGMEVSVTAECDGAIVGNSEVSRGMWKDEFAHGVLGIAIRKDFRNSGIGSRMLRTLLEECKNQGFRTVELEVFATNERAIHTYEKAGFSRIGTIPKKVFRNGNFIDVVVMSIEL